MSSGEQLIQDKEQHKDLDASLSDSDQQPKQPRQIRKKPQESQDSKKNIGTVNRQSKRDKKINKMLNKEIEKIKQQQINAKHIKGEDQYILKQKQEQKKNLNLKQLLKQIQKLKQKQKKIQQKNLKLEQKQKKIQQKNLKLEQENKQFKQQNLKLKQENKQFKKQRAISIYYRPYNYSISKYEQILYSYTQKISQINQDQNEIRILYLKIIMKQIYYKKLFNVIQQKKFIQGTILIQAWKIFQQFHISLLNNNKINWVIFKLQNQEKEQQFRLMMLQFGFNQFIKQYKKKIFNRKSLKGLKQLKIENIIQSPQQIVVMTQISIKQSFIYDHPQLLIQLKELIDLIKKSAFIKYMYTQYFKVLKSLQKQFNQNCQTLDEQTISIKLNKLQILFIDYAAFKVCGITMSGNNNTIYINLMRFHNYLDCYPQNKKMVINYTFFILLHQITHYLIRKMQLINENDNSNPWNVIKDSKDDSGYISELFLFGGSVTYCSLEDFDQIKDLLQIRQFQPKIRKHIVQIIQKQNTPKFKQLYQKRKNQYQANLNKQQKNKQDCSQLQIQQKDVLSQFKIEMKKVKQQINQLKKTKSNKQQQMYKQTVEKNVLKKQTNYDNLKKKQDNLDNQIKYVQENKGQEERRLTQEKSKIQQIDKKQKLAEDKIKQKVEIFTNFGKRTSKILIKQLGKIQEKIMHFKESSNIQMEIGLCIVHYNQQI